MSIRRCWCSLVSWELHDANTQQVKIYRSAAKRFVESTVTTAFFLVDFVILVTTVRTKCQRD